METLTKKDLVDAVAAKLVLDREVVRPVIHEFLQQLVDRLGEGQRVEFRDFGVFEVKVRRARSAHNPRTLEKVMVPARRTVKFKPGRLMKERVDGPGPAPRAGRGRGPGPGPRAAQPDRTNSQPDSAQAQSHAGSTQPPSRRRSA